MNWLLDTNACISHLKFPGHSGVSRKLSQMNSADVAICSVVRGELLYGALHSDRVAENIARVRHFIAPLRSLPYDNDAAEHYADIRAHLAGQGTPIGPNDLLIAAIARLHDSILVTHNVSEFRRVPRLQLEDWEDAPETA